MLGLGCINTKMKKGEKMNGNTSTPLKFEKNELVYKCKLEAKRRLLIKHGMSEELLKTIKKITGV